MAVAAHDASHPPHWRTTHDVSACRARLAVVKTAAQSLPGRIMTQRPHIVLIGAPRLEGLEAPGFPAKGYALLAAVLLGKERRITREQAADLLWDDCSHATALGNLRQLLLRMGRALPPGQNIIRADAHSLSVNLDDWTADIVQLLDATPSLAPAERHEIVRSAGGRLLGGDIAPGGVMAEHAERLSRQYFRIADSCLADMTRFGRAALDDLTNFIELMLEAEPDREKTYRDGMEALGRCGYNDAAQALYHRVERMLRKEMSAAPEAETMAAVRRLSANAASGHAPPRDLAPDRALPRVAFFPPQFPGERQARELLVSFVADVASGLAQFRTFAVLSPHSSFAFMAEGASVDRALLKPDYTVESALVPGADVLAFRLIRAATGEIVWASDQDVQLGRLSHSFRQLSAQVSRLISSEIARDQMASAEARDANAYVHYLMGQNHLATCSLPNLRRARSEFKRATGLDKGFGAAHARIAQTLQLEWLLLGGSDAYLLTQARTEAEVAAELDPAGAGGHWMSAVVALYQRDYDLAAEKFMVAENLHPNSADLLLQHADALAHFGEAEAAWARFERAVSLNPYAPDIYWWAGASIAFKRADYAEAVRLCGEMKSDEPVLRLLAACHGLLGDAEAARLYGKRLMETYPGMSADDFVRASPDRVAEANHMFLEGLRLAGIH
jgi:DNA-binding SARP family transcriptional activator/Tfp pilus assembly protein PilF/TolB-like protein